MYGNGEGEQPQKKRNIICVTQYTRMEVTQVVLGKFLPGSFWWKCDKVFPNPGQMTKVLDVMEKVPIQEPVNQSMRLHISGCCAAHSKLIRQPKSHGGSPWSEEMSPLASTYHRLVFTHFSSFLHQLFLFSLLLSLSYSNLCSISLPRGLSLSLSL